MADNFIEFDAAGGGPGGLGHVKDLPEIITPQPIDDDDLVTHQFYKIMRLQLLEIITPLMTQLV